MESEEIAQLVEELETRLERLRVLYDQYFTGIEKIPPEVLRKDVDRRIWVLRREKIRNTGVRFKFQQVIQRYNTFTSYWMRICREIENGTYKRDVLRAKKRFGAAATDGRARKVAPREEEVELDLDIEAEPMMEEEPAPAEIPEIAADAGMRGSRLDDDLEADFPLLDASPAKPVAAKKPDAPPPRRPPGPPPKPAPALAAAPAPAPAPALAAAPAPAPAPSAPPQPRRSEEDLRASRASANAILARKVSNEDDLDAMLDQALGARAPTPPPPKPAERPSLGKTGENAIARDDARSKIVAGAPPGGRTTVAGAPPGARASVAKEAPKPAVQEAAKPVAREAPRTSVVVGGAKEGAKPAAASPDRALYAKYVEMKRKNGESTAGITYESMERQLSQTREKLKGKSGGKSIDFDVVVKDGKTILKPVVR